MRIIILTGRFGMGHMNAALAIKQQIDNSHMSDHVEVIDWLDYVSPKIAEKYYRFFNFLVNKGKRFYNTRYRFLENRRTSQKPELCTYFQKCFKRLMDDKKPELIISTLPFCSQIISRVKEETGLYLPLVTCVTDITGHSEWINKNTDFYFVGSQEVKDKFISKGVPSNRIFETGLPVRLGFLQDIPDNGIHRKARHILIMGGGLGMLPKGTDFYKRLNELPGTVVTVITGKNYALYERLAGRYKNITILGYVHNVYDYMRRADVIITKPGGITTFEAIHSGVPVLALKPSLQQEVYNARYIKNRGIGEVISGDNRQCIEKVIRILDSYRLENYRSHIKELKNHLNKYNITQILETVVKESIPGRDTGFSQKIDLVTKEQNANEAISFNL